MYKNQMKAQKILCLLAVIVAAVLFVYSLGIMTDLYDALYRTTSYTVVGNADDGFEVKGYEAGVSGAMVYYDMQGFNQTLVTVSIVYILLGALLFVTNTNVRRRYYIANYVSTGLFSAASIGIAIYSHINIESYKAQWQKVDFTALKQYADEFKITTYIDSTLWFDLHYVVMALMIIMGVLIVANAVWKVKLMKEEAELVATGKGVKAA